MTFREPLAVLSVAAFSLACGDASQQEASAPTIADTPQPPSTARPPTPYAAFAEELSAALEREDAAWFAERLSRRFPCSFFVDTLEECRDAASDVLLPVIEVYDSLGGASMAVDADFLGVMDGIFRRVDGQAEDLYGAGWIRLYAIGEQGLVSGRLIVSFLVTAIFREPESGRRAFVLKAERNVLMPEELELTELWQLAPGKVDDVLALGPLPQPAADPVTWPEPFAVLVEELLRRVDEADSKAIAANVRLRPYTCTDPAEATIQSVPSCADQPAGTTVDIVPWHVYCVACDAQVDATGDELAAWLDRFFAHAAGAPRDDLGPGTVQLERVSTRLPWPGYSVSVTGVADGDWFGSDRPAGRWVVTFEAEPRDDAWAIVRLTTADPAESVWVLPTWRGTNIAWTRWPPVD